MRFLFSVLLAIVLAAAALVVAVTRAGQAPGPGPDGVLARLDCSRGFPDCGWGRWVNRSGPAFHTVTPLPDGRNGARFDLTPTSTPGQFYLGWGTKFTSTAPTLYIRFHLTIHPPLRANGVSDPWSTKFIIVNDGGDASIRAIAELKPARSADNRDLVLAWKRNIEGPGDASFSSVDLTPKFGQRMAVQMAVTRGAQGRTAIWIDNPNPARPTSASRTFDFAPTEWRSIGLGFYSNMTVDTSGSVAYTIEDAVVSEAFDPSFR
jgi:hypothetical protein